MKRKLQEAEDVVNEIKRRCRFLAVGCVYNKMRCKQLEDAMGTVEMNFENRKLTIEFVGQRGSRVYRDITPRKRENELRRLCDRVATDVGEPIQPSYSHRANHMSNRPRAMIAPRTILSFHNEACKKAVMRYTDVWNDLTKKMGYWVDMESPYITYKSKYIESVWWLLKNLYEFSLCTVPNVGHKW